MDKIYHLDLATLVESLYQQTATLSTLLPKGVPGLSEPSTGYVYVRDGKIISCVIEGKSGMRMDGTQAFQLLRAIEEWHVKLEEVRKAEQLEAGREHTPAGYQPWQSPTYPQNEFIPRQSRPFYPETIKELHTKERMVLRMVYAMVNGYRSTTQIKEQLRLPADTIDWALDYLQRMGVID